MLYRDLRKRRDRRVQHVVSLLWKMPWKGRSWVFTQSASTKKWSRLRCFFWSVCHDAKSLSFLRIHPPDVIGKYAPDSVIGKVGSGAPSAAPAASGGLAAPLLAKGGHEAGLILEQKRKQLESWHMYCILIFCLQHHVTPVHAGKGLVASWEEPRTAHEGRGQDSRLVGSCLLHGPGFPERDSFHHCSAEERDIQWWPCWTDSISYVPLRLHHHPRRGKLARLPGARWLQRLWILLCEAVLDWVRFASQHCGRIHSVGRSVARRGGTQANMGHQHELFSGFWQVESGILRCHLTDIHDDPLVPASCPMS